MIFDEQERLMLPDETLHAVDGMEVSTLDIDLDEVEPVGPQGELIHGVIELGSPDGAIFTWQDAVRPVPLVGLMHTLDAEPPDAVPGSDLDDMHIRQAVQRQIFPQALSGGGIGLNSVDHAGLPGSAQRVVPDMSADVKEYAALG